MRHLAIQKSSVFFFSITLLLCVLLLPQDASARLGATICGPTVYYSVGSIDSRFGTSRAKFKRSALVAEKLWEDAYGSDLFEYDPTADLKLNLLYDETSARMVQAARDEFSIDALSKALFDFDQRLRKIQEGYNTISTNFQNEIEDYNSRREQYDLAVGDWIRSRRPESKYAELKQEEAHLDSTFQILEARRLIFERIGVALNDLINIRNERARGYNTQVTAFNSRYGGELTSHQAEFILDSQGRMINVFHYRSADDLAMTLAHEMGHALGLEHLDDVRSLMYHTTDGGRDIRLVPTTVDIEALGQVCKSR